MPIDEPSFPNEEIILLNGPSIILTSSGCTNPQNAVDNDPATFAAFDSIAPFKDASYLVPAQNANVSVLYTGVNSVSNQGIIQIGVWSHAGASVGGSIAPTTSYPGIGIFKKITSGVNSNGSGTIVLDLWEATYTKQLTNASFTMTAPLSSTAWRAGIVIIANGSSHDNTATYIGPFNPSLVLDIATTQSESFILSWLIHIENHAGAPASTNLTVDSIVLGGTNVLNSGGREAYGEIVHPSTIDAGWINDPATMLVAVSIAVCVPPKSTRYLRADWGYNALVTRVRLKQEIPGGTLSNTGIDFESALGYLEGYDPPPDIPFQAYIPFPVDANTHELTIDPPVYARGIVVLPDAYADSAADPATLPEVDLYQLQVYQLSQEGDSPMALPTKKIVRVGAQAVAIFPWVASSSYPFPTNVECDLQAIKGVDMPIGSKEARLTGGETIHQLDSFEVDREYSLKITAARADRRSFFLALGGTYTVDLASGQGGEVQYLAPNLTDRATYVSVVIQCTNGSSAEWFIFPKCKVNSAIGFNLQRDNVTDIDIPLLALWDTTYIRQDGVIGGIYEDFYEDGASTPAFHS